MLGNLKPEEWPSCELYSTISDLCLQVEKERILSFVDDVAMQEISVESLKKLKKST